MFSKLVCRQGLRPLLLFVSILAFMPGPASLAFARQDSHKEDQDAPRITVAEVLAQLDKQAPIVIIDSRSESSWEGSDKQIKGSVRIPIDQIEARMNELPKDKEIVIYCS
jgi:hypothetical protein